MRLKIERAGAEIEGTFRISTTSREFDVEPRGGFIIRAYDDRPGTDPEALTLTLILAPHEMELLAKGVR